MEVAAGLRPAAEPGILPGGMRMRVNQALEISSSHAVPASGTLASMAGPEARHHARLGFSLQRLAIKFCLSFWG
jgi:hypothetical protein